MLTETKRNLIKIFIDRISGLGHILQLRMKGSILFVVENSSQYSHLVFWYKELIICVTETRHTVNKYVINNLYLLISIQRKSQRYFISILLESMLEK